MSTKQPRVIFAGTGSFAVPMLRALQPQTTIVAVVSQTTISPIGTIATQRGLRVLTPTHIDTIAQEFNDCHPDLLIVADYGQIIPDSILSLPRYGCLNIHPSLLPRYRGASPIPAAILNGDTATGVTIIVMDTAMDHGPILAQTPHPLTGQETAESLEASLAAAGAELLLRILPHYLRGEIKKVEQNHAQATYCQILRRSDGELAWEDSPENVSRKIRAYYPWPGVWCRVTLRGKPKVIKLLNVQPWTEACGLVPSLKAGLFFWQHSLLGLRLTSGALAVAELQAEGGRKLSGEAFYRGYHDIVHDTP